MKKQIHELKEQRAKLLAEQREMLVSVEAEGRDFSAEEAQEYDRRQEERGALTTRIDRLERMLEEEPELRRQVNTEGHDDETPENRDQPVAEDRGNREATYEERGAFLRDFLSKIGPGETRALSKATAAAGANLVPTTLYNELIKSMRDFGVARDLARVTTTDSGEAIDLPTVTGYSAASWTAENAAAAESDPVFGKITMNAYKNTCAARVSFELLQDTAFDIEEFIKEVFGEAVGILENTAYTIGDGVGKPTGYQPNVTVGKTGAVGQTLTVTYDDLVDLSHSVKMGYRRDAVFVMNDASVAVASKLKSTTGEPLWRDSLVAGEPDLLMGYKVFTDPDMPVMAANAISVVFGSFKRGYRIRDVGSIEFQRLNEIYALQGQIAFLIWHRTDGKIVDAAALRGYRNSAT